MSRRSKLFVAADLVCYIAVATTTAFAQPDSKRLATAAFFPATGSKDVCPDTPLRITFASPPLVGSGKIRVFDAADDSVVDTIDVAAPTAKRTIGGLPNFNCYPILISGDQAALYLSSDALKYDEAYYVKLDPGTFKYAADHRFGGISDAKSWRFTTKVAPPSSLSKRITVAADGSGDFATVQGAIDFIPDGNTAPATIFIRNGIYNEIICFTSKHSVTIVGEDRKKTIIAYPNNDRFNNNSGGNPFGQGAPPPAAAAWGRGAVYRRGMFLAHRCNDLTITNLTLHNTTPQGGTQAESLILNGSQDAHARLIGVDLYSFQDTLQINGQAYIRDCYIEGDVDFMWGTGPCFFENCHARTVRNNAYYTQIRNPPTHHGYIFKDCTFDGAPGITGNVLSRIAPARFPASEVVLINCTLTDAVSPIAWKLDQSNDAPDVHFWEYNSHTPDSKPVDTTHRLAASKQLKLLDDEETISNYSDPKYVLGGTWTPDQKIANQP